MKFTQTGILLILIQLALSTTGPVFETPTIVHHNSVRSNITHSHYRTLTQVHI
jgi:hypothetical protein